MNLFKSNNNKYLEQLYADTKAQRDKLLTESEMLKAKLITENEQLRAEIEKLKQENLELLKNNLLLQSEQTISNNSYIDVKTKIKPVSNKLSPREQEIYDFYLNSMNYDDVFKKSKMKPATFEVYLSRIRKKGYELKWN